MALASVGSLGTAGEGASGDDSLALTTSATLEAGNLGILLIVSDNAGASGNTNHHSSVTDSNSNTYTKLYEQTYSPGSTGGDGVTVSAWWVRPSSDLNSGSTVTMTQSANTAEKCATMWEFTTGAGIEVAGTVQTSGSNTNHPGSLAISGLTSGEYLYIRAVGKEVNSTNALTATTNYTTFDGTRSRNNSAAVLVRGEFRIETDTGDTSNPTMNVIADTVNIFLAVKESAAAGISGTASITLDGATLSAAGTLALAGVASITLDGATTTAAGAVALTGEATITLDGATLAAAGAVAIDGEAVITLDGVTLTAEGALGVSGLTGQASITLDNATLSAAGVLTISGQASITLDDASLSAAGEVDLSGIAAIALDGVSLTSAGALALTGQASITLDGVTLAAVGGEPVAVTGLITLTVRGRDGLTVNQRAGVSLPGLLINNDQTGYWTWDTGDIISWGSETSEELQVTGGRTAGTVQRR